MFWFNPTGNTWRLQRLDYSDNLLSYFWDGRVHTFNTVEGNMIFTPDFDFFDIRTTPGEFLNNQSNDNTITGEVDGSIWFGLTLMPQKISTGTLNKTTLILPTIKLI